MSFSPPPADGDAIKAHCTKSLPKRSAFGTLFSRTLPAYSGRYPVGVRDVELPIPPRTFGTFKHRSMPDGQVGITLDTIMFMLFYPTVSTTARKVPVPWFPRLVQTVNGLLKVANWSSNPIYKIIIYAIVAVITWGTTFPAVKNAPLREPPRSTKWRVILFSHGAGCSQLMNSAVCGELASRGYVVAAIEHHEGTGPSVRMTNEHGKTRDLNLLNWIDLEWTDLEEQPVDDATLRRVQLAIRLAEVDGVLAALRHRLTWGRGLFGWDNLIQVTRPIIVGHSFGGSLAMAAATDCRFDFSHVIVFDPAIQRLESWNDMAIPIPLLSINSEEYATSDEFSKLLTMASSSEMHKICVIPGATHPSFSDVFLILPDHVNKWTGLVADPLHIIHQTIDNTNRFLEDETIHCVDELFLKGGGIGVGNLVRAPC